jgi:hypothetical protein
MIPNPNLRDPLMFLGPSNDIGALTILSHWRSSGAPYEWQCLPSKAWANAAQESAEKEKSN